MMARTTPRPVLHEVTESMGEAGGFAFKLVVAPSPGRMRHLPPVEFVDGIEWVTAGQPVAVIEQGSSSVEVRAPIDARVAGVLVRDGEPVFAGQPLVWLDPTPKKPRPGEPEDPR